MTAKDPASQPISIRLNGRDWTVESGLVVADLLADLDVAPEHVVVEVDGEILSSEQQESWVLQPGAEVELVRFVGGG